MSDSLVIVTSRSFSTGRCDLVAELESAGCRVARVSTQHDLGQIHDQLGQAAGWIAGTAPVTAAHFSAAPKLKVLARYGVGTDAVDLSAATAAGVQVTNTPGANSNAVSEHTLALLLAALRGVACGDARLRLGDWTVRRGQELAGSTVGIIGFGRIGQGTARLLNALDCTVLAHDPYLSSAVFTRAAAQPAEITDLAARCDTVILHAPGGRVLIDASYLANCRAGQLIINTARADLVDEAAIAAALSDGHLAGYAADTLQSESGAGEQSPLLATDLRDCVTVTPHLGAQTVQAVDAMGTMSVANVLAVLAGKTPPHPVNIPARRS